MNMGFWLFMLAMDLLIPAAMAGCGRLLLKRPPKRINAAFGYRTARSMKTQESWDFAQAYCGKLWFRWGLALLPLSAVPLLLVLGRNLKVIGNTALVTVAVEMALFLGSIFPVEAALKKNFDQNGFRR